MTDPNETIKAKIVRLQNLLVTQTKNEITIQYLQQVTSFLKNVIFPNQLIVKSQAYEQLRETVKSIFSYLEKTKLSSNEITKEIEKSIKQLLLAISHFCSNYYFYYHPVGCGDMIKEFLSSDCTFFVLQYLQISRDHPYEKVQVKEQNNQFALTQTWIWSKQSSFKTIFFCQCLETIMRNIEKIPQKFGEMKITAMSQYVRLLYYLDDYLIPSKAFTLFENLVELIQNLFRNPTKQTIKDPNKQILEDLTDYITRLLRGYKNDDLKKRVQLIGPLLGITLIKMPSIQKKIVGCKIVSKFSYEMLYRNTSYINQLYYCQWLISQNFFQLVFEEQIHLSLIKASQQTFKLLVKKSKVSKEKFHRIFEIMEKSDNQIRKAMFRAIEPFRLDYYQIQTLIQLFKTLKGVQFYDEEYFYFVEGLSRYATQSQLNALIALVQNIINHHYSKFDNYLVKRRSLECYAYVFERLIIYRETTERVQSYIDVAVSFINDPSYNKLVMFRVLFDNLSEHKLQGFYQEQICQKIINQYQFIQKTISFTSDNTLKEDLIATIKMILKKYSKNSSKDTFSARQLLDCVQLPQIFEEMLKLTKDEYLQNLLNSLSDLSVVKEFSFDCFKLVFYRLNNRNLKPIKKQWTDVICTHATNRNPSEFAGLELVKYIIFNSNSKSFRKGACELLVESYTNLFIDFREQGEQYLVTFLQQIVKIFAFRFEQFFKGEQSLNSVKGTLELMEELMLNTQYFGVGQLKSHNSLVPTSTISLKIYNNTTHGDDVLKIFQKKFPSNKTLFEVLVQVSKQFKVCPLDVAFEFPNSTILKQNGLTLEELKLNNLELNVVKLPQSRLKKQQYLIDGKLNEKAVKAFTDLYNRYAVNSKMGEKQCAAYIEGVTQSSCFYHDTRISSLFADYDKDKDGNITLEDFLQFYYDSVVDPDKVESVDKNLANLRYRRDLKQYDEEIDNLNPKVLLRYHICEHKEIYESLFKFVHYQDLYVIDISQRLLLRLPTYSKIIQSLNENIQFKDKNSFEVEYMLTALESQIISEKDSQDKLLKDKIHIKIFQYFSELSSKQNKTNSDNTCLIICLHILRSLIKIDNLKQKKTRTQPKPTYSLPKTDVFIKLIKQGIKSSDPTLLEPAFALQFTQQQISGDWIEQSAFNRDKDIRILTCNFLYYWCLGHDQNDINLFKIQITQSNNEEWFNLLTSLISIKKDINYQILFKDKLQIILQNKQSLEFNRFNQIIHGNLKIIKQIYPFLTQQQKDSLEKGLKYLLPQLISNENREIVYHLRLFENSSSLLDDIESIVNITIAKQTQPRYKYVGIKNLGCICYMNSIIQQFFMNISFRKLIMSLQAKKDVNEVNGIKIVDDFLYQLQLMYVHLESSQKQYYDPTNFCLTIKDSQGKPIKTHIQQDAHEFLNTAFDKIQGYAKPQEKLNLLDKIFGGKTVTEIICLTCKNKIERLQHFYHLTLQIKGMKTLKESLDKFIQPQQILDYNCQNCGQKVQKISKQTLLKQTPQIIIINLQRITFDLETFAKVKIHSKLQFDQNLDLKNYFSSSSQPASYSLKGFVIHSGTSEGGHYYSLIKSDNQWYKFNDQSVTTFSQNDIGREAYGGQQQTDNWGEYSSSTNAYILFYQRVKKEEQSQQLKLDAQVDESILQIVKQENVNFKKQLQFYQPSFFAALNQLFELYLINSKQKLQRMYSIYLSIIKHLSINSDIKNQTIVQIKQKFLKLMDTFPEKSSIILEQIQLQQYVNILLSNNDSAVRDIFSSVFSKIVKIQTQNPMKLQQSTKIAINHLAKILDQEIVTKNIHKASQYFDLIKDISQINEVVEELMQSNSLQKLLMLIMGSTNLNGTKDKNKSDLNRAQVVSIIPIIQKLIRRKRNMVDETPFYDPYAKYYPLTTKQKSIFRQGNFYNKTMEKKLDVGLLAPIIALLGYRDIKYSQFIIEVLLNYINNSSQNTQQTSIFKNLSICFMIEDEFSEQRMKWILGYPQLEGIKMNTYQYGLMTSSESKAYNYLSGLLCSKDNPRSSFLNTLFEKRKYYNYFSAMGILTILELANDLKRVREYIVTLPPPTYIYRTYFSWFDTYIYRIRKQQHYGLPYEKAVLAQKIQKLMVSISQKLISQFPEIKNIPLNKKIIGKNHTLCSQVLELQQASVQVKVLKNITYTLPNIPISPAQNESLPTDQFSFGSAEKPKISQYFLSVHDIEEQQVPQDKSISIQLSVMTLVIKSQQKILVKFKLPQFRHNIYVNGEKVINFLIGPEDYDLDIKQFISIDLVQKEPEQQEINQKKTDQTGVTPQFSNASFSTFGAEGYSTDYNEDFMKELSCKVCTYFNVGRDVCEMCGHDLFK